MKKLFLIFLVIFKLDFVLMTVFPPTSPTRHQWVAGIGIPLQLKDEAITLGILLKAQYFLVRKIIIHSNIN